MNWNVVAIADSTGAVKERYRYDAFGKRTVLAPDFTVRNESEYDWDRSFTGQVQDKETGLLLYRNRYYHPTLGRFVNRDPLDYEAGDANLYRYVANQPIVGIDPSGLVQPGGNNPPGTVNFGPGGNNPPGTFNFGPNTENPSTSGEPNPNGPPSSIPQCVSTPTNRIRFNDDHGLIGIEGTQVSGQDSNGGRLYRELSGGISGNPSVSVHPQRLVHHTTDWLPQFLTPPGAVVRQLPEHYQLDADGGFFFQYRTTWINYGQRISLGSYYRYDYGMRVGSNHTIGLRACSD